MTILVRKALIIDPTSPHHRSVKDIFIANGTITEIGDALSFDADTVLDSPGLAVSPGWTDIFAHFNDPGAEHKETIASGAGAAIAGGFVNVCVLPNTQPAGDTKGQMEYVLQQSRSLPVNVYPLGAVSKGIAGKELAEMYDMKNAGAVAFSDGIAPVQSAGLLLKALQYVKAFNGIIIQLPVDKSLGAQGLMHEGITSTRLGLPGIPALAEELIIQRDIELLRYTESRLHITGVSTAKGIALIERAKQEGLPVSCSVTPYHLLFSDEDLHAYDTNLKVSPPLRTRADVTALRQAVERGVVDCIASHHLPQHWDNKVVEFEYARDGMITLESAFSMVNTALPELDDAQLVQLFTGGAAITGLHNGSIDKNNPASLTIFNRTSEYQFGKAHIRSKSQNTPLIGITLRGKVIGTVNKGLLFLNELN